MSDIDRIDSDRERLNGPRRGPYIGGEVKDSRVTRFINWILAGVGSAVVFTIWHFGTEFSNELTKVREELVKTNTQLSISIAQNARLEEDVKDHEARLRTLEGRNLRGLPRSTESIRGN
jgi:hypothetical protein